MLVLKCNDFRNQHFFYKSIKDEQHRSLTGPLVLLKKIKNAEGGHDWFHIERVYKKRLIAKRKFVRPLLN
jgi:hypothetical protein